MDQPPPPQPPQRYAVGDVINLLVTVVHLMRITKAKAVFAHQDVEGVELVLEGEPELYKSEGLSEEGLEKRLCFMVMSEEVTTVHVPGIYRFSYVELETASLRTIPLGEADINIAETHKKLEIVADPDRLFVSVRLSDTRYRPLDHDDCPVPFESMEDPDEE